MDNQEYWAHKTQDEDKQSNTMQHRKLKEKWAYREHISLTLSRKNK
jgi:hypothetical protein